MAELGETFDAAVAEGVEQYDIEQLADKDGDLTAEDLRGFLDQRGIDTKNLSDEDVLQAYAETEIARQAGSGEPQQEPQGGSDRPWAFVDGDGKPVADLTKLTVEEALKLALSYKVDGQDRRHTLDDLIRLAQREPLDKQRITALLEQRNGVGNRLAQAETELAGLRKDKQFWLWVLQDRTGARFVKAVEAFEAADFQPGGEQAGAAGGAPDPLHSFSKDEETRGELVYQQEVKPLIQQMARSWSVDGQAPTQELVQHTEAQIEQAFRALVAQEGRFLHDPTYGPWRIRQIIENDLPALLAEGGYRPTAAHGATDGGNGAAQENARLKAEIANLKAQRQKEKVNNAPDAGGGSGPAGAHTASDVLSKVKTKDDMFAMLRDPNERFGM